MSFFPDSLLVLQPEAPVFTRPTFSHMRTLVYGILLASGRRTVTTALRAMGRGDERHFTTFHRVLNRAVWSPLHLSRILLGLLVIAFSRSRCSHDPAHRWHVGTPMGTAHCV
jgi:hypothetical protein